MSHVDYVEDKWKWYVRLEYGVRTVVAYLGFGGALGMVQCRHALMQQRLRWRAWSARHLEALPREDEDTNVRATCHADPGLQEAMAAADDVLTSLIAWSQDRSGREKRGQSGVFDEDALRQFWTHFWRPLLSEFHDLVAMTHAEAVHVRLLTVFEKQADALYAHSQLRSQQRHTRRCGGGGDGGCENEADAAASTGETSPLMFDAVNASTGSCTTSPDSSTEDDEDAEAVFVMSKTDKMASANLTCRTAPPPRLRYNEAVRLADMLSEILACELHCLHTARAPSQGASGAVAADTAGGVQPDARGKTSSTSALVEPSCVALMLPNSVEYNIIWLACARAGCLETLLGAVDATLPHAFASPSSTLPPPSPPAPVVYRPCAVALINTNLVSNAMLYHALQCAGSCVVILDALYAPLLFATPVAETAEGADADVSDGRAESRALGTVNVPACVKRIFFWRLGADDDAKRRQQVGLGVITKAMEEAIDRFNCAVYDEVSGAAERAVVKTPFGCTATAARSPPLDLWALVEPYYMESAATATAAGGKRGEARVEEDRLNAVQNAWKRLRWLPLLSRKVIEWYGPVRAHGAVAASTACVASLRASFKVAAPAMATALARFAITEPVLYIYTSGTTGLPKAARFSHLRFFATAFLSRLLSMRQATRRVLREQAKARQATSAAATAAYGCSRVKATTTTTTTDDAAAPPTCVSVSVSNGSVGEEADASVHHTVVNARFAQTLDQRTHTNRHSKLVVTLLTVWHMLCAIFAWVPFILGLTRRHHYSEAEKQEERALSLLTVYNALPMYHTVGCVFCLGHLLHALEEQQVRSAEMRSVWREPYWAKNRSRLAAMPLPSARMVIRAKYSASNFRTDLDVYRVTVVQYIGEILRYAVLFERRHAPQGVAQLASVSTVAAQLPAALPLTERALLTLRNQSCWRVPYAFGNGLRLDIWQECMDRLNVAQPVEFYSSTEGNIFLFNLFNIPGSIGHIPRLGGRFWTVEYLPFFPFRVLRFEEETQNLWRDPKSGFCARVAVGEVGEVCGEVVQGFDMFALRRFDGYHHSHSNSSSSAAATTTTTQPMACAPPAPAPTDADAQTQKKLVRHVMWPNADDLFFRSGDLIKFDADGFCFFVDRVGETFRWKGENVSTLEVSNALNTVHSSHVGILEAVVYGVKVPGREGSAGMAMLTLQPRVFHTAGKSTVKNTHKDKAGTGAVASCPAVEPTSGGLSLEAERRFLQNELYQYVSGQCAFNGDGSVNQAALPAYAVPLFIRMTSSGMHGGGASGLASVGKDSHNDGGGDGAASRASPHNHLRTSTFKYIKHLLVKEGYEAALDTSINDSCWCAPEAGRDDAMTTDTPVPDRYYVLITNALVYDQLCLPSREAEKAGVLKRGYLPLTKETIALVGDTFDQCGW